MEGEEISVGELVPAKKKRGGNNGGLGEYLTNKELQAAAGRKGAAKTNAIKKAKKEQNARMIEDALAAAAERHLGEIINPYIEALGLKPDPSWSPRTKLEFFIEQTTVSEKIASRLEGLPVARRREVDVNGNDRDRAKALPSATIERVLSSALASGSVDLDDVIEIDEADVTELPDGNVT